MLAIDDYLDAHLASLQRAEDETWTPLQNRSSTHATQQWDRMPHDMQVSWVAHHAHLGSSALRWAMEHGEYSAHLANGLKRWHALHLDRQLGGREFSLAGAAQQHEARIISALRAAENSRSSRHWKRVVRWLTHHSTTVVEEAVGSLSCMENEHTERLLVALLRDQLGGESGVARLKSAVGITKRTLRRLLGWSSVGSETISEAVRQLLRWPAQLQSHPVCESACTRECNPHTPLRACRQQCHNHCEQHTATALLFRQLVRKAMSPPNEHNIALYVALHIHHAHPSHRMLLGLPRAEITPGPPSVAAPLSTNASVAPVARRHLSFWDGVDFASFALTFIDMTLNANVPAFSAFWGEPGWMGKGKIGAAVDAELTNSVWVRLSLFGSAFGLDFDDTYT